MLYVEFKGTVSKELSSIFIFHMKWLFGSCYSGDHFFWFCRKKPHGLTELSQSTNFSPRGWRSCRIGWLTPATCCTLTVHLLLTKMFLIVGWSSWRYKQSHVFKIKINTKIYSKSAPVINAPGFVDCSSREGDSAQNADYQGWVCSKKHFNRRSACGPKTDSGPKGFLGCPAVCFNPMQKVSITHSLLTAWYLLYHLQLCFLTGFCS